MPGNLNIGPPDGSVFNVACGQSIIVSLGGPPINTHAGYDFVYYESQNGPGIQMDWVIVEVCIDALCSTAYQVFNWYDGVVDGNTNLTAPNITPGEPDNYAISNANLYGSTFQTGIEIDVDAAAPAGTYPFVRITSPLGGANDPAQVDALEVLP